MRTLFVKNLKSKSVTKKNKSNPRFPCRLACCGACHIRLVKGGAGGGGEVAGSTPDSRLIRLCSRTPPCGSYGPGSPTAVAYSRKLVSCGNGGTLCRSELIGHVSSVRTLDHFTCNSAPSSYRAILGRKSLWFPDESCFHLLFRIFSGLQHLCVTTDSRCLTRELLLDNNIRIQVYP